jgi:antitoxin component of MazEF toxin-antitoxin module
MVTRLRRDGDSIVLVIDQPFLDQMQIDTNTPLDVSVQGERLIVEPVRDSERRREFDRIVKEMNERYAKTFHRLAE